MADDGIIIIREAKDLHRSGQIDQAIETLLNGLKNDPKHIAMQDLLQQYQNIKDLKRQNKEIAQNEYQNQPELRYKTYNQKCVQDIDETKQKNRNNSQFEKLHLIANNTFQMRLKVVKMELKVVETFSSKGLIDNENDVWKNIETSIYLLYTAIDANNFKNAESELLIAENYSTQLMEKIKKVINKNSAKKEELKIPQDYIGDPDYRSIVTVRGTKEDVANCILKAKMSLENGKYDRAESLLLKAERILPTKNAKDLLKQVRTVKKVKQNSEFILKTTEAVKKLNIVQEEEPKEKVYITDTTIDKRDEILKKTRTQIKIPRKEVVEKGKSKKGINDQPEMNKTLDNHEAGLVKNKDKIKQDKNGADEDKTCIDDKIGTSHKIKLQNDDKFDIQATQILNNGELESREVALLDVQSTYATPSVKSRIEQIEKDLGKTKTSHFSSTYNADNKTTKPSPKKEQVENFLSVDEKVIRDNKFGDTTNFLNTAEYLHISKRDQDILPSNSSKVPIEANESIKTEALKCFKIAQAAFQVGQYIRAERLVLKSLRICYSQNAISLLNTVRDAKIQNSTIVNVKMKKKYKEYVMDHSLNEEINEYNKCTEQASKASAEGNSLKAKHFLSKASRFNPNDDAREQLNYIQVISTSQPSTTSNKKFVIPAVDAKDDSKVVQTSVASECIEKAQNAVDEGNYQKAYQKSDRIYPTIKAKDLMQQVKERLSENVDEVMKATKKNNVRMDAGIMHLKRKEVTSEQIAWMQSVKQTNDDYYHVYEKINEYNKCMKLASKSNDEGNLDKAERFLSKTFQINPTADAQRQLKLIQDVKASQHPYNVAKASKTVKSNYDLELEKEAETLIYLIVVALSVNKIREACYYYDLAIKKRLTEKTTELLGDLKIQIDSGSIRHSLSKHDINFEASKLLDQAVILISNGELEKAESLLIVSWDMNRNRRTVVVHKKFLEARMALFIRQKETNSDGNVKNIYESDRLVKSALDKYESKKYEEAKLSLMTASEFHPSVRINNLLVEIEGAKILSSVLVNKKSIN